MFKLENAVVLQKDEELLLLTKRHWIFLAPRLTLAFFLIVVPFFFLFPLFRTGPAGILVFLTLVAVGVFVAVRSLIIWDGSVLIITSLRAVAVEQTGIFNRSVVEISGSNIWDAKWEQKGLTENMMHFGLLVITAANVIKAQCIPNPQEAHKIVNELIFRSNSRSGHAPSRQNGGGGSGTSEPESARSRLQKRLESLDDESLSRIEQALKNKDREITIKKLYGEESSQLRSLDHEHEDS